MATLQVRSIDSRLYELLGRRAEQENRSISQEVIAILKQHLTTPQRYLHKNATEEFLELAGTWSDSRSAKQITHDLRKSRKFKNRFKGVF